MALYIFIIYTIRTIRNLLCHIGWWETKEYRFDRMKVHLFETVQGKRWMFGPVSLIKWALILLYSFHFPEFLDRIVFALYTFEAIKNLFESRHDKRPSGPRPKVVVLIIGTLLFELLLVTLLSFDYPLGLALLIGDKLLPFAVAMQVIVLNSFFTYYKRDKMMAAREKFAAANITVIGITGSYGKTTIKEFIYQILKAKYKVFKTEKSQNSDIGIAEVILRTDLANYDYFVCEMAAYHPGEIKSSTSIIAGHIQTAVITGINEQHQSLFGSLETTKKAKYELVQSLSEKGTVIVNGESVGAKEMGQRAKTDGHTVTVIRKKDFITSLPRGTAPHFKMNATLAAHAAESIGMKKSDIEKAVTSLELPEKTMHEEKRGNVIYINDTFNANPDAVYAALNYIKRKKGTKVLVLQPLIELGRYADAVHEKIGEMAADICDHIILTNINWHA
ncbi:hypothetical protein HY469_04055, partial [Candidatus Roizmanbacteria bacterium]|nr:hypothetical protein [Candidatus Roizmanbacteria bacterium]